MHEDDTLEARDDLDGIVPGLSGEALRKQLLRTFESARLRRSGTSDEPPGPHPEPERLLALRAGELRVEEEEPLLAHLGDCEDCSGMVAFFAAAGNPEPVDSEELAAAWARLPGRIVHQVEPILEARDASRPAFLAGLRERTRRWVESWSEGVGRWRLGAELCGMAALAVIVVIWQGDQAELDRLSSPQANVAVFELSGETYRGVTRGIDSARAAPKPTDFAPAEPSDREHTPGPIRQIELGSEEEMFTLALDVEADHPRYRIRLLDSAGEERWADDRLKVDDFGIALLGLHRRFLGEGLFTLEVAAADEEGKEKKRWVFQIEIPAS